MRLIVLTLIALAAYAACGAEQTQAYPLWDRQETIVEYAEKTGLVPVRTLDLGNGVKLELVLIPAGKFIMGTEQPESLWIGGAVLTAGCLALMILFATLLIRGIRARRWPQFSLRWLILLVVLLGVAQYGGVRFWRATEAWKNFHKDCEEALSHEVTISTPFYLGRYEVTQEQYHQVMGVNPSHFKGRALPVEGVSWNEAQEFCKRVNQRIGSFVRLPSEAEWEYACRVGTMTRFFSGDADIDLESVAWYGVNSNNTTHPVGQKAPNAWGLYDMHGNVLEWCSDWFAAYKADAVVDPQGPVQGAAQGPRRVVRGGSWDISARLCRSACRLGYGSGSRGDDLGFRVAVVLPIAR